MTSHIQLLSSAQNKKGGTVTFGDNNKKKIIGICMLGNIAKPLIENALLVKSLQYNLLSISQLCNNDYKIVDIFTKPLKEDAFMKFRRELSICAIFDI